MAVTVPSYWDNTDGRVEIQNKLGASKNILPIFDRSGLIATLFQLPFDATSHNHDRTCA